MFLRVNVCGLTALSVAQSPPHLNKICGHIDQYKLRNVTIQIFFGTVMKEEKCNYWFLLDCVITCLFELPLTSEMLQLRVYSVLLYNFTCFIITTTIIEEI